MDDTRRIMVVETKTVDAGVVVSNAVSVQRYQLNNNIESATLEIDESANIISYEEYYPYGETSYRAGRSIAEVGLKRYRYTGKEKGEESGLYYHGARYYACWLGKWTAIDSAGMVDRVNLYMYCKGNPVKYIDPNGMRSNTIDLEFKLSQEISSVDELKSYLTDVGTFELDGREHFLYFEGELSVETVDGKTVISGENLYAHEIGESFESEYDENILLGAHISMSDLDMLEYENDEQNNEKGVINPATTLTGESAKFVKRIAEKTSKSLDNIRQVEIKSVISNPLYIMVWARSIFLLRTITIVFFI